MIAPSPLSHNPARDTRILELAENHTAENVAEIIGGGLTRNAVIGVCHRAGMRVNGGDFKRKAAHRTFAANWTGGVGAKAEPEPRIFKGRCKYIAGDPALKGWKYCDKQVCRIDSPYCAGHHALTHDGQATASSIEKSLARPYRSEVA